MMRLVRRFLVVAGLMFWQGGFTFYAGVVVPIGRSVIRPVVGQTILTQHVTHYLNLSGAVVLLLLAWDAALNGDSSVSRRRLRWAAWAGMCIGLALLVWLHGALDHMLDFDTGAVTDAGFRPYHRAYLWVSTIQWGLGLVYLWTALGGWRQEDTAGPASRAGPG